MLSCKHLQILATAAEGAGGGSIGRNGGSEDCAAPAGLLMGLISFLDALSVLCPEPAAADGWSSSTAVLTPSTAAAVPEVAESCPSCFGAAGVATADITDLPLADAAAAAAVAT